MTEYDNAVPAIAKALAKRGYETLTPVQQSMLDPALVDADALVSAAWLRTAAHDPALWAPAAMTPHIARTEGWTFGVP